jgi:hypothetical protein
VPADHDRDPVTVEERGVTVEKSFDTDSFPLPTVVLTLTNRAGSPAHVSLVDAVPEDVPMSDVGFHPDYGADHWEAYRNGEVVFDRDFDAGESVTTVYAVRAADADDGERFAAPPSVTVERPADARATPERDPADAGLDDAVDAAARAFVEDVDRE